MKSSIIKIFVKVVILVTTINNLTAQQCGTVITAKHLAYMDSIRAVRSSNNIGLHSISNNSYKFPIVAFIITKSDGTGGLNSLDLQRGIDGLNENFTDSGISFKLVDTKYISDEKAYEKIEYIGTCINNNSKECMLAQGNYTPNAINLFFAPKLVNGSKDLNGWSSFPGDKEDKNWIFIKNNSAADGKTIAHEIGHYFNLYHTHEENKELELVNQSNCLRPNVGDEICDTPSEPFNNNFGIAYCVNDDCEYNCVDKDDEGNMYMPYEIIYEEYVYNTMSYAPAYCNHQFSPQQVKRMHESIENRTELIPLPNDEDECATIFNEFSWLKRKISCKKDSITVFVFKDILKFVTVQSTNDTKLYLMDGQQLCENDEKCFDYFQSIVKEVDQKCVCIDNCALIGCTDRTASNYNPSADCNDSTLCNYEVKGCIDESACNFDMEATINDGSCNYGDSVCDDPCDTCIDCSKNQGIFTLGGCGRNLNYMIKTDDGMEYVPVFDQILSFPIKQGTKVNFDFTLIQLEKGNLSVCNSDTKIRITCIEKVNENRPDITANLNGIDEGLGFPFLTTETLANADASIYPNPSNGIFNVIIKNELTKSTKISIYNLLGEKIIADTVLELKEGIIAFDLSRQLKGIYLIEINDGFKATTKKIVLE